MSRPFRPAPAPATKQISAQLLAHFLGVRNARVSGLLPTLPQEVDAQ